MQAKLLGIINWCRTVLSGSNYTDLGFYRQFLLLRLYLSHTTNHSSILFAYLLHLQSQGCEGPLLCYMDCSWLKKLMDQETGGKEVPHWLMYNTLGGLFGHVPEICLLYQRSFFLIKSKTSGLGTTKCQIIWVSKLLDVGLKEFCCIQIPLS